MPDWILKLPKPSKMKRREMGKVKRADVVNAARRIGRQDAIKKRWVPLRPDMVRSIWKHAQLNCSVRSAET